MSPTTKLRRYSNLHANEIRKISKASTTVHLLTCARTHSLARHFLPSISPVFFLFFFCSNVTCVFTEETRKRKLYTLGYLCIVRLREGKYEILFDPENYTHSEIFNLLVFSPGNFTFFFILPSHLGETRNET